MKRTMFILLSLLLACGVPACNNDEGPGGTTVIDTTQGVQFTRENAMVLAHAVVSVFDTFPDLNGVYLLVTGVVESYGFPEPMPEEGYPLGNLGICSTGAAVGTWLDADDSQSLSDGDAVTLEFTDCDGGISGTLAMDFNSVSTDVVALEVDLALDFVTTLRDTFMVETLTGRFDMEVSGLADPVAGLGFTYRVSDPTDGGAGFSSALDGVTVYEMGCFEFPYTLDLATGGFVLSEPYALFRVPGCGVMTMRSDGMMPFECPTGEAPVCGQVRLCAEAGVAPCSGLDVPGDGVVANCSTMAFTAVGSGGVTLSGNREDGTFFLVNTNWYVLN